MQQPILVVGSVALDDIESPAGARVECLGGSANYFSVAARHFAPVRLVAVVGDDFPEGHLDLLRARGIDLKGLERVSGRTFRWKGRYGADFADAETLDTQLNVFEHFEPKVPEAFRDTPVVFLANIHPALQLDVLRQVRDPAYVALDTMNFWITGERDALLEVVARVDLLVINETEAQMLAGESNVFRAADAILRMGPKSLLIKRGAYGALLFHADGRFFVPAVPLADVVDPTGAGDTFAAGAIGYAAGQGAWDFRTLKRAVLAGTALASFTCEGFSLERLLTLRTDEIESRITRLRAFMNPD